VGWILDRTIASTSEEGSRQLVYAAVGEKADEKKMRGAFISWGRVEEVSDFVLSEEGTKVQDRIWVSDFYLPLGRKCDLNGNICRRKRLRFCRKFRPKFMALFQEHLVGGNTAV
jgi:hypothetical protein